MAQSQNESMDVKQIDKTINEIIYIHTNTQTYVTGEKMYYTYYCRNKSSNKPSSLSKIGYIELIDQNKKSVFKHKLFLEDGVANGDFFIPATLATGNYKLIGYTRWMLNYTSREISNIEISIINPYNRLDKVLTATNQETSEKLTNKEITTSVDNGIIGIVLEPKKHSTRELVNFKIVAKDNQKITGHYAVSVRKISPLIKSKKSLALQKNAFSEENKAPSDSLILPELRGELITGKLQAKNPRLNLENKFISLSIPGKLGVFKITKTNTEGIFNFILEKPYPSSELILQVVESNAKEYTLMVLQPKKIDVSTLQFEPLSISPEIAQSLEERSIANQIENAYSTHKKDSIVETKPSEPFYGSLSKEYILDNFNRFPTLKETIIEVIDGMYYKERNGIYSLHVRDYDDKMELSVPALVLVDGLLIQDINDLLKHKAENFYKIDIVKGGYYFGPLQCNGIIAFTTKKFDYENNLKGDFITYPTILRPAPKKIYFQPNYQNNPSARIPDFRYQLLWNPEVELTNLENNFSLYTSDVKGSFEIRVDGITNEGVPISLRSTFEVQDK